MLNWRKYVIVFLITLGIFLIAIYLSNYFNNKKIDSLKSIQDRVYIDLLSSETKFNLLEELSCTDVGTTFLSEELSALASKITFSENNRIGSQDEIDELKRYYSLLEIKDYILMKRVKDRCGQKSVFVLYFYADKNNCPDCEKQGYVLDSLYEQYPEFRVYSFDYNLDLSALKALISIYKIKDDLPALVINGRVYNGFQSVEDIEKNLPAITRLKQSSDTQATSTATSTKVKE